MSNPNKKRLRRSMMFLNAQKPSLIKDPYIYKIDSLMLDLEDAVAVTAKDTATPLEEETDVVFLGASVYAGSPNVEVAEFIKNNADKIGKIALFGSSASGRSTYEKIKALCTTYGVELAERFFHCPGKFLFMHKGRPNQQDLSNAVKFAESLSH